MVMVKVEVHFLAHLAAELGIRKLIINTENTLPEAISEIEKATGFPLGVRLGSGYGVLINGRSYHLLKKEKLVLKDGDKIVILPMLGGG
jgi:molybdopterin converting factor small subunit